MAAAVAVACVALGLGAVTFAHPTATSFVVIQAPAPDTVTVTVTTEASPLLMKLDALAGRAAWRGQRDCRQKWIAESGTLGHVLLGQFELRLDDSARATRDPEPSQRVTARPEQIQIVIDRARVPHANASLRWRTSLFFGSYPLAVRAAGSDPEQRVRR